VHFSDNDRAHERRPSLPDREGGRDESVAQSPGHHKTTDEEAHHKTTDEEAHHKTTDEEAHVKAICKSVPCVVFLFTYRPYLDLNVVPTT
jgi:hypothetical protein